MKYEKDVVSIIIPVHNTAKFLDCCLQSVLKQSYPKLDIILINDGSTDESGKICNNYASEDSRINLIIQENKGYAETLNVGLKEAKGEYLSFVDSDDIISPNFIEILLKVLKEGSNDLVACKYGIVYNKIDINKFESITKFKVKNFSKQDWYNGLFKIPITKARKKKIPFEMLWGKLYKRELLKDLYFFNLWGADREFNSRFYSKITKSAVVLFPLYFWVQRENSNRRKSLRKDYLDSLESLMKIFNNISEPCIKRKAFKRLGLRILSEKYEAEIKHKNNKKNDLNKKNEKYYSWYKDKLYDSNLRSYLLVVLFNHPKLYYKIRDYIEFLYLLNLKIKNESSFLFK